jgi:hypothetical protein
VRAALRWLIEREEAELPLRFFAALAHYWVMRGYQGEGRRWLDAVAPLLHAAPHTAAQARALAAAAELASALGDNTTAHALAQESIALAREQHLQQEVQQLRIEIDHERRAREVADLTEGDYFQPS